MQMVDTIFSLAAASYSERNKHMEEDAVTLNHNFRNYQLCVFFFVQFL